MTSACAMLDPVEQAKAEAVIIKAEAQAEADKQIQIMAANQDAADRAQARNPYNGLYGLLSTAICATVPVSLFAIYWIGTAMNNRTNALASLPRQREEVTINKSHRNTNKLPVDNNVYDIYKYLAEHGVEAEDFNKR